MFNSKNNNIDNYIVNNGINEINFAELNDILNAWLDDDFEPDTDYILSKNVIKEKVRSYYGQQAFKYPTKDKEPRYKVPTIMMGKVYYLDESYSENDIQDMQLEMVELNIFDMEKVKDMSSLQVVQMYIDEDVEEMYYQNGGRYGI